MISFDRELTPAGLFLMLLVGILVAVIRGLDDPADRRGPEAEARRVQERMKQYQDEWESKNN